jgi:hypothetical protein
MTETLRPMSLGEILDRAVQMLKAHFPVFVGIAAIPALATLVYSLSTDSNRNAMAGHSIPARLGLFGLILISWLGIVLLSPMAAGAKCWAASRVLLERPVNIRSAYGAFMDRKGRLLGLGIMQGILAGWPGIIGIILVVVVVAVFHVSETSPIYFVLIALAFVPCLPLYTRYLLAYPATAIADLTVHESLKRSVELGRGYRWKIFWAYALPVVLGMVVIGGGVGTLAAVGQWSRLQLLHPFLFAAIQALWTFAGSLVYEPLTSIALTLTYYDMCVRKEGLDIVQMMALAGLEPALPDTEPA